MIVGGRARTRSASLLALACSLSLILLVSSCQSPTAQALDENDVAAIRRMTDEWLVAHGARDWEAVGRHYTEDAIIMPPMAPPIRGRSAIQAWFEANEHDTRVEVVILEIEGFADLAYVRGESKVTMGVSTESPTTLVGKYLDIRRRQRDGSWLVSVDMFSPDRELE